jgi:hypothetical protein
MNNILKPVLVFELGHLQVFHYQTDDEWRRGTPPGAMYWKIKSSPTVHGPFPTAYHAVNHYSSTLKPSGPPTTDNVIHVDFVNKKRLGR